MIFSIGFGCVARVDGMGWGFVWLICWTGGWAEGGGGGGDVAARYEYYVGILLHGWLVHEPPILFIPGFSLRAIGILWILMRCGLEAVEYRRVKEFLVAYIRHSFHAYFFLGVHVGVSARRRTLELSELQLFRDEPCWMAPAVVLLTMRAYFRISKVVRF